MLGGVRADQPAHLGDFLGDILQGAGGEVQADGVAAGAVGVEEGAGHVGDVLFKDVVEHLHGVHLLRQLHPQEHAALGLHHGAPLREGGADALHHLGRAHPVGLADPAQVGVKVALGEEPVHLPLGDVVDLQVVDHLHIDHLLDEVRRPHDPAHPEAGGDDLGNGAHVDHVVLGVKALDGGHHRAVKAQEGVGGVLQHQGVVLLGQGHQAPALLQGHDPGGGVLEVGDHVDQPHGPLLENRLHGVQIHPVLLHGDAHHVAGVAAEDVQGAGVAGGLHQHRVLRRYQGPADGVQGLGGAGEGEDVFRLGVVDLEALHELGQGAAQLSVAAGGGVLDALAALLLKDLVGQPPQVLHGEELRGGLPAGEGHHGDAGGGLGVDLHGDGPDGGGP